MKLTASAKAGLVLLAIGLGIFLAVAIWLKTTRTTLVDIPMPMRAAVTRKEFSVDYDGPIYGLKKSERTGNGLNWMRKMLQHSGEGNSCDSSL